MNKNSTILIFSLLSLFLFGCVASHQNQPIDNRDTLTLGIIQKDIKEGMSQSDVITVLGSPNIVTSDEESETWVYDKISSERSSTDVGGAAGGVGAGGSAGGFLGVSGSKSTSYTSQKTLTVIIKFDSSKKVKDISYHSSKY